MKSKQFVHEFHVLIEVFMLFLAGLSGVLLLLLLLTPVTSNEQAVIEDVDLTIAYIFLFEFVMRFIFASRKVHFLKHSWWEILAAIPISNNLTEAMRMLRLLRIGRLLIHIQLIREKRKYS